MGCNFSTQKEANSDFLLVNDGVVLCDTSDDRLSERGKSRIDQIHRRGDLRSHNENSERSISYAFDKINGRGDSSNDSISNDHDSSSAHNERSNRDDTNAPNESNHNSVTNDDDDDDDVGAWEKRASDDPWPYPARLKKASANKAGGGSKTSHQLANGTANPKLRCSGALICQTQTQTFNNRQDRQKPRFLQPLHLNVDAEKKRFLSKSSSKPPTLLRELMHLYKSRFISSRDYVFLTQGYIIIKTAQSYANVFLGKSDCLRREVLVRAALNAFEGEKWICISSPCRFQQYRRNILYEEEEWVRWASSSFPCLMGETRHLNDDEVENEEDEDEGEEENDDDVVRESEKGGGREEEATTYAVDYMETMKRELAAKHKQIKIVQKMQHKRHMLKWRLSVRKTVVPPFIETVSTAPSPVCASGLAESSSMLNKRPDRTEFLRRKQDLINEKNLSLSLISTKQ